MCVMAFFYWEPMSPNVPGEKRLKTT